MRSSIKKHTEKSLKEFLEENDDINFDDLELEEISDYRSIVMNTGRGGVILLLEEMYERKLTEEELKSIPHGVYKIDPNDDHFITYLG